MSKSGYLRLMQAMLVGILVLMPAVLRGQNVTLDLKNVTVQEAVTQLQSQGNYTIVINAEDVDLQKRILEEGGDFNTRACHNPLDTTKGKKPSKLVLTLCR